MVGLNSMARTARVLVCLLALIWFCGGAATAGAQQGRIAGTVSDPQGAAVSGAVAKLVNAAGAPIEEQRSDGQGKFEFAAVEPGEYQVSAERAGFVKVIADVSAAAAKTSEVALQFTQVAS